MYIILESPVFIDTGDFDIIRYKDQGQIRGDTILINMKCAIRIGEIDYIRLQNNMHIKYNAYICFMS